MPSPHILVPHNPEEDLLENVRSDFFTTFANAAKHSREGLWTEDIFQVFNCKREKFDLGQSVIWEAVLNHPGGDHLIFFFEKKENVLFHRLQFPGHITEAKAVKGNQVSGEECLLCTLSTTARRYHDLCVLSEGEPFVG